MVNGIKLTKTKKQKTKQNLHNARGFDELYYYYYF